MTAGLVAAVVTAGLDLHDGDPSRGALAAVGLGALVLGLAIGALVGRRRR